LTIAGYLQFVNNRVDLFEVSEDTFGQTAVSPVVKTGNGTVSGPEAGK
jgi:hypothetical protein